MALSVETLLHNIGSENPLWYHSTGLNFDELPYDGPVVWLPRHNLFGTQQRHEYCSNRIKRIRELLKADQEKFLAEHPLITCALPEIHAVRVAILNGHHRARAAGSAKIDVLPCKVFTPQTLKVALANKTGKEFSTEQLEADIAHDVTRANWSFEACQTNLNKKPRLLTLDEAQQYLSGIPFTSYA